MCVELWANLPDDIWIIVFKWLDINSVTNISLVSKRFNKLANSNAVWKSLEKSFLNILPLKRFPVKELCKISRKWQKGQGYQLTLRTFNENYMPWLQLNDNLSCLYMSVGDQIWSWKLKQQLERTGKSLLTTHIKITPQPSKDVTQFRVRGNTLIATGWNGFLYWKCLDGLRGHRKSEAHQFDVFSLNFRDTTVITGATMEIKIWNFSGDNLECRTTRELVDRVLSIEINPNLSEFVVGGGGLRSHPISVWDLNRCEEVYKLGIGFKLGAAPLDMQFISTTNLITAGYDTYIRLWDSRVSTRQCVKWWEEPHDNTIYCVTSDSNHMIMSGSCRHGVVRLWDVRMRNNVQTFYFGSRRTSSPVYSLRFTRTHVFAALARGLHAVEFT